LSNAQGRSATEVTNFLSASFFLRSAPRRSFATLFSPSTTFELVFEITLTPVEQLILGRVKSDFSFPKEHDRPGQALFELFRE
jgi:hypothetical protein